MISSQRKNNRRRKAESVGTIKYLLAGGSMLALVGVLADLRTVFTPPAASVTQCQEMVQPQATLSRETLSQFLTVPERDRRSTVQAIISTPYCQLSSIEVRAGVLAERHAYPLEFDPQTWFVVLYEGDEYAGYSFVFPQE
jgi:hypothetical protein